MDYLVNEFRGPATFVVVRYGLPIDAIGNLGFKMKPYRMRDGRDVYVLAPWEGSAFQALGLELSMTELDRPSWRRLLENVVDVEIDYADAAQAPGLPLGVVQRRGRPVHRHRRHPRDHRLAPAPDHRRGLALHPGRRLHDRARQDRAVPGGELARRLALLTDHGPWEGYQATRQEVIRFQTTAHTLALILGLLRDGVGPHEDATWNPRDSAHGWSDIFRPGEGVRLLADETQVFAWNDKESPIRSRRKTGVSRRVPTA